MGRSQLIHRSVAHDLKYGLWIALKQTEYIQQNFCTLELIKYLETENPDYFFSVFKINQNRQSMLQKRFFLVTGSQDK